MPSNRTTLEEAASRWRDQARVAAATTHGTRAPLLIEVRESTVHDNVTFDAMRQQTYALLADRPEVQAIAKLGMLPATAGIRSLPVSRELADGRTEVVQVPVRRLKVADGWIVLFQYAEVWHLWGGISAAKESESGRNEFTDFLCQVVRDVRPIEVVAANFSRLVRSQRQSNRVADAFAGNVDVVRAGEMRLELVGTQAALGWLLFGVLSMVASMERDWIAARMQAGKVAQWRRNEWPLGESTVPFGYEFNRTTKKLECVPKLRPIVEEMLLALAQDGLPPETLISQLGTAGVTTMRPHRRVGKKVPVSVANNPSSHLRRLYCWMPLWTQGEYLYRLPNVQSGVAAVSGAPVVRRDEADASGELQLLFKVPVPDGGWAAPEILEAAQAAALRWLGRHQAAASVDPPRPLHESVAAQSVRAAFLEAVPNPARLGGTDSETRTQRAAGRARRMMTLLAGWTWTQGQWRYELRVHNRGRYDIYRTVASDAAARSDVEEHQ